MLTDRILTKIITCEIKDVSQNAACYQYACCFKVLLCFILKGRKKREKNEEKEGNGEKSEEKNKENTLKVYKSF